MSFILEGHSAGTRCVLGDLRFLASARRLVLAERSTLFPFCFCARRGSSCTTVTLVCVEPCDTLHKYRPGSRSGPRGLRSRTTTRTACAMVARTCSAATVTAARTRTLAMMATARRRGSARAAAPPRTTVAPTITAAITTTRRGQVQSSFAAKCTSRCPRCLREAAVAAGGDGGFDPTEAPTADAPTAAAAVAEASPTSTAPPTAVGVGTAAAVRRAAVAAVAQRRRRQAARPSRAPRRTSRAQRAQRAQARSTRAAMSCLTTRRAAATTASRRLDVRGGYS